MSLEMAHKVILPPKKNYIPQFLKQRDINSYFPNISTLGTVFQRQLIFLVFPKMKMCVLFPCFKVLQLGKKMPYKVRRLRISSEIF
jgi:hypothetical protein